MIEDKLAQVGLSPPAASKPAFAYVPVTLHDGVAYVSGQLPKIEGEVRVFGKVGREVTLDAAGEEVRICVVQGWPASRKRLATCRICAGC
jgi:enamine deaminase RidA (YjgF/YER057c/UK114 family)